MQGRSINSSLNETGRRQAASFWEAFKDVPFQKINTSALSRSAESVRRFIDLGIPWEQELGLDEISWGDFDGKKISGGGDSYQSVLNKWADGDYVAKIKNGESPEDVKGRQIPVIDKIKQSQEELILVCMHGRAMRILLSHFVDGDFSKMDEYKHKNLGLYILDLDENGLSIIEANVIDHLEL